jgi:hypothetical protein
MIIQKLVVQDKLANNVPSHFLQLSLYEWCTCHLSKY